MCFAKSFLCLLIPECQQMCQFMALRRPSVPPAVISWCRRVLKQCHLVGSHACQSADPLEVRDKAPSAHGPRTRMKNLCNISTGGGWYAPVHHRIPRKGVSVGGVTVCGHDLAPHPQGRSGTLHLLRVRCGALRQTPHVFFGGVLMAWGSDGFSREPPDFFGLAVASSAWAAVIIVWWPSWPGQEWLWLRYTPLCRGRIRAMAAIVLTGGHTCSTSALP